MHRIYFLIFLIFIVHSIFNLEKLVFVNEVFSFLGILILMSSILLKKEKLDHTSRLVILFFLFMSLYAIYSYLFLRVGSNYEYFRTLPIVYSIPSYFLGVRFVGSGAFSRFLEISKIKVIRYSIAFSSVFVGGRLSNQILFPILSNNEKNKMFFIFLMLTIFLIFKGGATSFIYFLFILLFQLLKKKEIFYRIIVNNTFYITCIMLLITINYIYYDLFTSFIFFGWDFFEYGADVNLIWRYAYWNYMFDINISKNPLLGIGFGTPLFDSYDPHSWFITMASPEDEFLPYTHGTHNSLIYLLVRSGIIGLLLFLLPIYHIFKEILVNKLYKSYLIESLLISFMFLIIALLFNVFLETPLYASVFWITLGILSGEVKMAGKQP